MVGIFGARRSPSLFPSFDDPMQPTAPRLGGGDTGILGMTEREPAAPAGLSDEQRKRLIFAGIADALDSLRGQDGNTSALVSQGFGKDNERNRRLEINKSIAAAYGSGDMNAVRQALINADPADVAHITQAMSFGQPKYQEVNGGLYELPTLPGAGDPKQVIAPRVKMEVADGVAFDPYAVTPGTRVGPMKAPTTRSYRQGMNEITEEMQPDGTWKRLGSGALFKPDAAGDANKPPVGYRWGPGGSLQAIPGGPADSTGKNSKATDTQRVTALFADRAAKSNDILGTSADFTKGADVEGTKYFQQKFSSEYMPFGNYINSDDYQRYDQAKRDFVNAVLRKESGAVIGKDEFANAEKQYFPQPGDAEPVIQQKRRNRETAVEGLRRAAGTALDGTPYKPEPQRAAPTPGALPPLPQKPASAAGWIVKRR